MLFRRAWKSICLNWRISFIVVIIAIILLFTRFLHLSTVGIVNLGYADLLNVNFTKNNTIPIDGYWEFYWNRLLTSEDFKLEKVKMDSFIKVPGSWNDKNAGSKVYPNHGVATYRIMLKYPDSLKDPALSIKAVSAAYKLYANGQQIIEVGKVSDKLSEYMGDYEHHIVDLPNDTNEMEVIIQVSNLDYIRGGLRDSLIFGSREVLEEHKMLILVIQVLFMGSVFGYSIYYYIIYILNRKNKIPLVFSCICLNTSLRALVWGELPITILFPNIPIITAIFISYLTEYNFIPLMLLLIYYIYPEDYYKKRLMYVILPTLFFNTLLVVPAGLRASFNLCFYILAIVQMLYLLCMLIKVVLRRRADAVLLFIVMSIFFLTIISDMFHYSGNGVIDISHMFLFGNYIVILAIAFIRAKQHADNNKKIIMYNEKLIEMDKLKDKMMETELSFLQAQIKPHFLYNALNAIANVSEKDGNKGSKLILDLAIFLRGSLKFKNLYEMVTILKELEFIDTYFAIEQARFGDKIQLRKEIAIPLNYQIPVLILQPIVENAVRHGISKKVEGGTVSIKMRQLTNRISIEVSDDGVGMDTHIFENSIQEYRNGEGVGIININDRLLRLYGIGLEIDSEKGCGTCVKIIIPEKRERLDTNCSSR